MSNPVPNRFEFGAGAAGMGALNNLVSLARATSDPTNVAIHNVFPGTSVPAVEGAQDHRVFWMADPIGSNSGSLPYAMLLRGTRFAASYPATQSFALGYNIAPSFIQQVVGRGAIGLQIEADYTPIGTTTTFHEIQFVFIDANTIQYRPLTVRANIDGTDVAIDHGVTEFRVSNTSFTQKFRVNSTTCDFTPTSGSFTAALSGTAFTVTVVAGATQGSSNLSTWKNVSNNQIAAVESDGSVKTAGAFKSSLAYVTSSSADVDGPAGSSLLVCVRDADNGGTAVVLYENGSAPVIVQQVGSAFTTASPGSTQIQVKDRAASGGIAFRGGSSRNGTNVASLSLVAQT